MPGKLVYYEITLFTLECGRSNPLCQSKSLIICVEMFLLHLEEFYVLLPMFPIQELMTK